ncbi:MAG: PQQ-binding-like beta-propeller repeat protein [Pseudomonadota bacterium]|uniref:outer membrane protein assembly factor BamB family protein n=1 Tax=unclassified Phenylobacterium TaxID=2640670 RepID=UPI0006F94FCB|nr:MULTISPECIES: PQQ-binding-like beta-propeller repeat protein [unclassified Phenylobacterium]KRB39949.1 hypothetical protein ASE02_09120 [Phenylobacterium sp. Root700]MBT9469588.1 PQQ-binding-like beta-propeller repeat protein [Phenylobacterium sp.]
MPSHFLKGMTALAMVLAASTSAHAARPLTAGKAWPYFGGSHKFERYSPLSQINAKTIGQVTTLWTRPSVDKSLRDQFPDLAPSSYLRGTPIMIDGVLYSPNGVGLVEAFDAETGATIWVQKPFAPTLKEAAGQSTRGVDVWGRGKDMRIISIRGEYLYALDAKTGELIKSFGDGGRVSLNRDTPDHAAFFDFNGPIIVGDVVVIGGNGGGKAGGGYADGGNTKEAKPEDIRGYDVRTGKLVWTFQLLPPAGEPGHDTWGEAAAYAGNMAAWAPLSADPATGYVYVPTTSPTNPYYGGHRPGDNLYANSLLVLDAKTGKRVWHFQMVHHDVWDYDSASPPTLADLRINGRVVKAVIATNKTGLIYVFDRITGKPVWPIDEKPAPQSEIPGEHLSPTQPIPSKPPPYDRVGLTDDDLIDFTPALRTAALAVRDQYVHGGMFTPPSSKSAGPDGKKGSLLLPGDWGSGNWNTGAFDPETGRYYAVSMTMPAAIEVSKSNKPEDTIAYREGVDDGTRPAVRPPRNPWGYGPDGLPLVKPPYGRITAYDMNRGELLWVAANGDGPRDHPLLKSLNLPPLGNLGRPVALVTKSLLFVGDSSDTVLGGFGISGAGKFRAFDKATGKLLWETEIPAGTSGGPITYEVKGKQFIVVPVGSKAYGASWVAMGIQK